MNKEMERSLQQVFVLQGKIEHPNSKQVLRGKHKGIQTPAVPPS